MNAPLLSIKQALQLGKDKLHNNVETESIPLDCELLLANCLEKSRTHLHAWPEQQLNEQQTAKFISLLERRALGEPVAYILGEQDFWDITLRVDDSTLIPRPETELLIETAFDLFDANAPLRIADMGTGTGAIAIVLAKHRPNWKVVGVELSDTALALAEQNARQYKLKNLGFIQSNWFDNLESDKKFDVMISNPPYIAEDDPHLQQGDVRFEPRSALASGQDGLDDIRLLVQQAKSFLKPNGILMFEHGFDQAQQVNDLLQSNQYRNIEQKHDLNGHIRISYAAV